MSDNQQQIVHCVYFQLKDPSKTAIQSLVDDAGRLLGDIPGVRQVLVGPRCPDLQRPVNDQAFDVALTVLLANRAAHDAYQTHPQHLEFVKNQKDQWANVRVFDALG